MKFVEIALFLLCIQLSIGIVNALGIFEVSKQYQSDWVDSLNTEAQNNKDKQYSESPISTSYQFDLGATIKGLVSFSIAVGLAVVSVPYTLGLFGVVAPFNYFFSIPVYFIYFMALMQIIGNRGLKSMY